MTDWLGKIRGIFQREQLIRLEDFEMWVSPKGKGLHQGLRQRAEKIARGKDPGPVREAEFHWIIERELSELCRTWQNPQEKIALFNLGAHIGFATLKMDQICKANLAGKNYFIYAVEPNPRNFVFLEKNLRQNQVQGKAFAGAISDHSGKAQFYFSSHSNLGSLLKNQDTTAGATEAPVYTLPTFAELHQIKQPHFIKIDVEGAEVEVLKGAREFLAGCQKPCKMIMEVHPTTYSPGRSLEAELKFLFENGWRPKYMVSAGVVQPDKFQAAGLKPFMEFAGKHHGRGIYRDFKPEHLLDFAAHAHQQEIPGKKPSEKIVRSIFLEKTR